MITYTQKELNNAVNQARMEIIEAVKASIGELNVLDHVYECGIVMKIEEIEEGFIGKSDKS